VASPERNTQTAALAKTLAEMAERIARYRSERIGEQNTKATLIIPVLRALGWDVEDLDEVHLEYRRRGADKPVDFALLLQRDPVLFIEAKALGEDLNDRRWASQVISYAAVAGVEWVVLTNGDEYRIYNAHAPVPVEDKLFRRVSVATSPDEAADALRLLTKDELLRKSLAALWRAQSIDNRVRRAVESLFEPEPSPWLVRRLTREMDGLTQGDVRAALARARIVLDFPQAEPPDVAAPPTRRRRPDAVAPPDGAPRKRRPRTHYAASLKDLIDVQLIRPGAELRKRYLGQVVTATVEPDGRVRFAADVFDSPSTAAGAARVSVKGAPDDGRRYYQTNGWTFWETEARDGNWCELEVLRQQYLASRGSG
jgi:hypothetical protein